MDLDNIKQKIKEMGYENIDTFIRANLHYVSEEKRKLFLAIEGVYDPMYKKSVAYGKG